MLSEKVKILKGLAPKADRFDTNPATDVLSMANGEMITFIVAHQGGTTGNAKIQLEACDNVTPSNSQAIPFRYRKLTTGDSDTIGNITEVAAATGVTTVGAEDTIYECSVKAEELPAGYPFVRCKLTEVTNDPVNGVVIALLSGLRHKGLNQPTAIA